MESAKQRVHQLEFQNRRLSETVEVQKSELTKRDKIIEEQTVRWNEAQTVVLSIRRSWEQLLDDIVYLAQREGLEVGEKSIEGKTPQEKLLVFLDPFLKSLLAPDQSGSEGVSETISIMKDFAEEVEITLKEKSTRVHEVLSCVLETLRGNSTHYEETESSLSGLQDQCDRYKGVNRAVLERCQMIEDKLMQQESELTEAKNKLAEVENQLQNAQRKIAGYKQSEKLHQQAANGSSSKDSGSQDGGKVGKEEEQGKGEKLGEVEKKWFEEVIKKKSEELEKERRQHSKTQMELKSAENTMKSESWISKTHLYKLLLEQRDELLGEVDKKRREIEKLHFVMQNKDRELSKKKIYDPERKHATLEALEEAQKKIRDLRSQIIENDRLLHDKEHKPSSNHLKSTLEGMDCLVKSSQQEVKRLRARLKTKEDSEMLSKAREEVVDSGKKMKLMEVEIERLKESLKKAQEAESQSNLREQQLYDSKEDLKVFVDVLATCDVVDKQWKECEMKAREKNILRENTSLKRKLAEVEKPETEDLVRKLESSQRKVSRLVDEKDKIKVEKDHLEKLIKHSEDDMKELKQLRTALEEELEETGAAYEEIQSQNEKLLSTLKEKETEISELRHQKTKLNHKNGVLSMEVETTRNEIKNNKHILQELSHVKTEYQEKTIELQTEINHKKEQMKTKQSKLDDLQKKLSHKEMETTQLKNEMKALERGLEEKAKGLEMEIELHQQEKAKRQKLESEFQLVESFKEKMRSGTSEMRDFDGSREIELLNGEIEAMRRSLNCRVCGIRRKSVVLVKCMHTFCKKCIDDTFEKRRRRCPHCGSSFSKDDIKPFYLS